MLTRWTMCAAWPCRKSNAAEIPVRGWARETGPASSYVRLSSSELIALAYGCILMVRETRLAVQNLTEETPL